MLRAILALSLLLPTCSGCAACAKIFNFLFSGDDESWREEHERQNAIFEGYEQDREYTEGKASNAWNPSTLP